MISDSTCFLFAVLFSITASAQNFNDLPGVDDEMYHSLLFPPDKVPDNLLVPESFPVSTEISLNTKTLVEFAYSQIGIPYRGGGTGNGSYDCSGFTQKVFRQIGLQLPHNSLQQAQLGKKIELNEVRPGDLLFFKGRNSKSTRIGHVALVSEVLPDGTIKMVHATIGKGVMIDTPFRSSYYKARYIGARRVIEP